MLIFTEKSELSSDNSFDLVCLLQPEWGEGGTERGRKGRDGGWIWKFAPSEKSWAVAILTKQFLLSYHDWKLKQIFFKRLNIGHEYPSKENIGIFLRFAVFNLFIARSCHYIIQIQREENISIMLCE